MSVSCDAGPRFEEEGFDMREALLLLLEADLAGLGVTKNGHRRAIVAKLATGESVVK